jgi:DNA-binding MarR family transcriptional regulator
VQLLKLVLAIWRISVYTRIRICLTINLAAKRELKMKESIHTYQQKAAEMGSQCVCFNVRKSTRLLTAHYDRIINAAGLKTTQLSLLMTVLLRDKANLSQLANMLGMDRTTLSRNIRLLEQKGLLTVTTGADKREQCIKITDKGMDTINQAIPLWEKAQAEVVERLGEEWVLGFLADLKHLNKVK